MRIVSLLPSATEILFALGLGDDVAGVTFECDYPPEAKGKRIVSTSALPEGLSPAEIDAVVRQRIAAGEDLYRLDRGALSEINPELIITQDLCAVCAVDIGEVDDAMAYLGCSAEVLTLDPMSIDQVLDTIIRTGVATGTPNIAAGIVAALNSRLAAVVESLHDVKTRQTLVLEWTDPAFTAGHWVPDIVTTAGGTPLLSFPGENSRHVEWDTIRASDAEVIVVAPCGYRLDGATALGHQVIEADLLPTNAEVWAIDADAIVVRPGPRVVEGVEVMAQILHPDRTGHPSPKLAHPLRLPEGQKTLGTQRLGTTTI